MVEIDSRIFYGVVALLIIVVAIEIIKVIWDRISASNYRYDLLPLFTKAEAHFYKSVLLRIEQQRKGVRFLAKIRVADIVKPRKGLSKKEWNRHFWRTSSKHIDFVAIDTKTLRILACIELNDSSHKRKDRAERDKMIDKIMESAGVPMVWIPVKREYDKEDAQRIHRVFE